MLTYPPLGLHLCAYAMARLWALPRPTFRPGVLGGSSIGGIALGPWCQRRGLITLGIETSCDDTCVAILDTKGRGAEERAHVRARRRVTCANKHHRGVHPVEAVESHTRHLPVLVDEVLDCISKDRPSKSVPDLIAVTRGPGMKPCLSVGVSFAKALSVSWGIPLVGVHHMQAHALTVHLDAAISRFRHPNAPVPQYPFLTLLYGSNPLPLDSG